LTLLKLVSPVSKRNRGLRRFVNGFVFANLKLIGHNWRDHVFPSPPPAK
jgi:hypothetical protein